VALGVTVDGHNLGIANRISKNYQGPKTYQRKELGAADGSGKLTFTELRESTNSSDSSPKGTISGSYSWTCHD